MRSSFGHCCSEESRLVCTKCMLTSSEMHADIISKNHHYCRVSNRSFACASLSGDWGIAYCITSDQSHWTVTKCYYFVGSFKNIFLEKTSRNLIQGLPLKLYELRVCSKGALASWKQCLRKDRLPKQQSALSISVFHFWAMKVWSRSWIWILTYWIIVHCYPGPTSQQWMNKLWARRKI